LTPVPQAPDFFHFGPDDRLFGSFAPPAVDSAADVVVVLAYPFGDEYMKAHKAFRQIATLLTRHGLPVLRFDYQGTGDSLGSGGSAGIADWIEDVRYAMEEARRRSGATRLHVGGLRLGASLAALASEGRADVARLVLWDAVVSGADYIAELDDASSHREGQTWWVNGFPVSETLRAGLRRVDLRDVAIPRSTEVIQMLSGPGDAWDHLATALADRVEANESRVIASPSNWSQNDDMGRILMPRDMVRGVVTALSEAT